MKPRDKKPEQKTGEIFMNNLIVLLANPKS